MSLQEMLALQQSGSFPPLNANAIRKARDVRKRGIFFQIGEQRAVCVNFFDDSTYANKLCSSEDGSLLVCIMLSKNADYRRSSAMEYAHLLKSKCMLLIVGRHGNMYFFVGQGRVSDLFQSSVHIRVDAAANALAADIQGMSLKPPAAAAPAAPAAPAVAAPAAPAAPAVAAPAVAAPDTANMTLVNEETIAEHRASGFAAHIGDPEVAEITEGCEKRSSMHLKDGLVRAVVLSNFLKPGACYYNKVYVDAQSAVVVMPLSDVWSTRRDMQEALRKTAIADARVCVLALHDGFKLIGRDATVANVSQTECTFCVTDAFEARAAREVVEFEFDSLGEEMWSRFFASMGLKADHHDASVKIGAFRTNGRTSTTYTPDFVLKGSRLELIDGHASTSAFVEIKSLSPTEEAKFKCENLARNWPGTPVLLIYGPPYLECLKQASPYGHRDYRVMIYLFNEFEPDEERKLFSRDGLVFVDDDKRIFLDDASRTSDMRKKTRRLVAAYADADKAAKRTRKGAA